MGPPKISRETSVAMGPRSRSVRPDFEDMNNIPKKLRADLLKYAKIGNLVLAVENVSRDGTRKRAYELHDGQLIESVLMPYEDGRNTACVSSQAGCAMGCVFCATGQMGFARQLTPDEIFEQVARFAAELKADGKRLSNVVMMGMGEPLANYNNVMEAIRRMGSDLGIGARKITVSTVGLVPNIRKLMDSDVQVRLAVSLHCANDEERTALLPANRRYGGLTELMSAVREYTETTKRRMTFEWALIEGQNDSPEIARELGNLVKKHDVRPDMVHVNLIPLNPTGGFGGSPSGRNRVDKFVQVLESEFGISATPRVRRGIDIDAGCGQLKAKIQKHDQLQENDGDEIISSDNSFAAFVSPMEAAPEVGVYEDEDDDQQDDHIGTDEDLDFLNNIEGMAAFAVDLDDEDSNFDDPEFELQSELEEADRLISLVQSSFVKPEQVAVTAAETTPTTTITDDDAVREAKKRRKKLIKNLKAIDRLKERRDTGMELND
eukprot:CAMPEP_0116015586 /NCGR_PEP_ID=MMETSP0321-20121206/6936_1 /TAXON_ID=163516 /ORGANISM="Leptocylindrus danicus var. danicus, Strain B650" /LENGTH=491 /DNA_ID=CAMNT_0003485407 /DNA_START=189 /DNA_END=1661 /DNA_ORIENTATION=-